MNIYISLDMEGMPGTWNWQQEKTDRESVKKTIFNHTKDVIQAIKDSPQNDQVEEIVIADSHSCCDNLSYDITEFDRRVKLISGEPRPDFMMPAFDERFDMVFFLGYHSGYGVELANMDHTYSNSRFQSLTINDMPMDETLINAAYAGLFKVPVVLISGDLSLANSIKKPDKMPWVEFVVTKEAVGKYSAINYSSLTVRENTISAIQKVLANYGSYRDKLITFSSPIKLSIEFKSTAMADVASYMPYSKRIDGRTIEFTDNDFKIIFNAILALRALAFSSGD